METFNQKQYEQATPIPAKFLLPDGTVVDELPTTGLQNGLIVAPRGTVYKAIEIKIE